MDGGVHFFWCVVGFLQAYNGAVTAVATIFIAAFTIVLARVTARQARLTREGIDLANRDFAATHRPWVAIDNISLAAPLTFDVNGWRIELAFSLSNCGNSPARNVAIDIGLVADMDTTVATGRQQELSARGRRGGSMIDGTIFPNGRFNQQITIYISNEDIAKAHSREDGVCFMTPRVVGCVSYKAIFDDLVRQTGFDLWLRVNNGAFMFNPTSPGRTEIPLNELTLVQMFSGWSAD